jgi:hypothetical protein
LEVEVAGAIDARGTGGFLDEVDATDVPVCCALRGGAADLYDAGFAVALGAVALEMVDLGETAELRGLGGERGLEGADGLLIVEDGARDGSATFTLAALGGAAVGVFAGGSCVVGGGSLGGSIVTGTVGGNRSMDGSAGAVDGLTQEGVMEE